jgi:hypothetical protein
MNVLVGFKFRVSSVVVSTRVFVKERRGFSIAGIFGSSIQPSLLLSSCFFFSLLVVSCLNVLNLLNFTLPCLIASCSCSCSCSCFLYVASYSSILEFVRLLCFFFYCVSLRSDVVTLL